MISAIFFLLFVIAENVTDAGSGLMRLPSARKVKYVDGLIEQSQVFGQLWDTMRTEYDNADFRIKPGTAGRNIVKAGTNLETLNRKFVERSYNYVMHRMWDYCQLAIEVIGTEAKSTVVALIGLSENHRYCMLTAFADHGFDVDVLFESIFLLQTMRLDQTTPLDKLAEQLEEYAKRYERTLKDFQRPYGKTESDLQDVGPLSTMRGIKEEITKLADLFCPHWTPFARHDDFNETTASDDVRNYQNYSLFMRYVFEDEQCVIFFRYSSHIDDPKYGRELIHEESLRDRIVSWKCDGILESAEYRLQKYEEDVSTEPDKVKEDWQNKKLAKEKEKQKELKKSQKQSIGIKVKSLFCKRRLIPLTSSTDEPIECQYELSLAALKNELKSKIHYLNVVKYYNVAANVMLLVAIKEGTKMFKGIKHRAKIICSDDRRSSREDEIHELKLKLSMFKYFYDKLVSVLLDEKRIDVTAVDKQKELFEKQVKRFLEALNGRKNNEEWSINYVCGRFDKDFEILHVSDKAHTGDENNEEKLAGFYLTEPILNVVEMYNFVANDFL